MSNLQDIICESVKHVLNEAYYVCFGSPGEWAEYDNLKDANAAVDSHNGAWITYKKPHYAGRIDPPKPSVTTEKERTYTDLTPDEEEMLRQIRAEKEAEREYYRKHSNRSYGTW